MKKILFLLIASLFLPLITLAAYEYTERVKIQDYQDQFNNFVVEVGDYDETYLIHHSGNCGKLEEGREIILIVRGTLDGNNDRIRNGNLYECDIDQAELFDVKLEVIRVSTADTTTEVRTEDDKDYRIYYSEACHAMKGLNGYEVYLRQFGYDLNAGDLIYLPGNEGQCAIRYAHRTDLPLPPTEEESERDIKKPTMPTNVKAYPGDGSAYLFWDASKDNVGIKQYIIAVSPYRIQDTKEWDFNDMPGKIFTGSDKTSYKVTGLPNDDSYFFYVIAEDYAGNLSSEWSWPDDAFVKSAIIRPSLVTQPLIIRLSQETDSSFLFRWNDIKDKTRDYTVILKVDGDRELIFNDWMDDSIRIAKKSYREGEDLELIVRTYNIYGQLLQDEYEFSF
jgi:hypothetical protein